MLRILFLVVALLAATVAKSADLSGVYVDTRSGYSNRFLVVVQNGDSVVLLNPIAIASGAPAGQKNYTGFGVGTVSGNVVDVPEFYRADMYCVNHNRYTFSYDGQTVTGETLSSTVTPRGASINYVCSDAGGGSTRTKVF